MLSDGTHMRCGEPLVDLHAWNEQVPRMGPDGPTLGWACQFSRALDLSLRQLAEFLARDHEFDDIAVIRANIILTTANQTRQLMRMMHHYGFEAIPAGGPCSLFDRLHRSGENIMAMLLAMAVNPAAVRGNVLWWDRAQLCVSRKVLEKRWAGSRRKIAAKIAFGAKERPVEIVLHRTSSASP